MSMRDEIRAALTAHGPQSIDEILPRCPRAGDDRKVLITNMYVLKSDGMVRRAGLSDDGEPLYAIDRWPARETPAKGESAPAAMPAKAAKAGLKVQRGAAKVQRPAAEVPAGRTKKTAAPSPAHTPAPAKSQRPAARTARRAGKKPPAKTLARHPGAAIVAFEGGQLVTAAVPRPLLATLWHSDTGTPDPTIVSRTRSGDIVLTRPSDGAYSVVPAVIAREIAAREIAALVA